MCGDMTSGTALSRNARRVIGATTSGRPTVRARHALIGGRYGHTAVIDGLTPPDAGRFLCYDGSEVPW